MGRGGKREGSGRKRIHPEVPAKADKGIASRVLAQVSEEDFWLEFLHAGKKLETMDAGARNERRWAMEYLTNRRDGKPAQGVFVGDTRESTRDLDFGDLPMPAGPEPGTAGKPN